MAKRIIGKNNLKQPEEVINECNRDIEQNPKHILAYFNRGKAKYQLKLYHEAIEDFSLALNLYPKYRDSLRFRGLAKQQIADLEGAQADLEDALTMAMDNDDIDTANDIQIELEIIIKEKVPMNK